MVAAARGAAAPRVQAAVPASPEAPATAAVPTSTIVQRLLQQAEAHPEKPCLVCPESGTSLSFSGLVRAIGQLSHIMSTHGVAERDRVALLLPNSPEFVIAYFAAMVAGGVVVPINPSLSRPEVEGVLRHSGARALIVGSDVDNVPHALGGIALASASYRLTCLQLEGGRRGAEDPELQPGDCVMVYTSGTSGPPKAVLLQHGNLVAALQNMVTSYELTPEDVTMCVLPLSHVHGQVASMIAALCSGGTLVLPWRFSAGRFWDTLRQHHVTWFSAVPPIFTVLHQNAFGPIPHADALRFARSASAPLPTRVLKGCEDAMGCPVIEAYGLTEATHQAATNPLPPRIRKPSSVGLPAGVQIAVLGESGAPVAAGEEGELALMGESIARGYYRNRAANSQAFIGPWFRSGDLGHVDSDGYTYITGRKREQINRGGEMISPCKVDEVLHRHPKVAEAATVGVPNPLYGEEVVAFVVLRPGESASEREIRSHCAQHLAESNCPKNIRFVPSLPRSPCGKIQRHRLLEAEA
jgi:acyl-CoA synthetase (AMP-forming)/AMP-acid ligase II